MSNEVKDHLVVVHTKNNSVGHVAIEIIGPAVDALNKSKYVRGFYPKSGFFGKLSISTFDVPGEVKNDALDWTDKEYLSSQAIAVTRSQAEAMIAHAEAEQASPSKYDLNDHNCVDFGNDMLRGYHAWAVPYVRLMKCSHLATRLVEPLARWRAEEIAYRMKSRSRAHYRGRVVRWIGEPMCWVLGTVLGWFGDPDRFYPQSGRNAA